MICNRRHNCTLKIYKVHVGHARAIGANMFPCAGFAGLSTKWGRRRLHCDRRMHDWKLENREQAKLLNACRKEASASLPLPGPGP